MTKIVNYTKKHKVTIWKNKKGEIVAVELEPQQFPT